MGKSAGAGAFKEAAGMRFHFRAAIRTPGGKPASNTKQSGPSGSPRAKAGPAQLHVPRRTSLGDRSQFFLLAERRGWKPRAG